MKKIIIVSMLIVSGCDTPQNEWVIDFKKIKSDGVTCKFATSVYLFEDSCHLYKIGDTIKH